MKTALAIILVSLLGGCLSQPLPPNSYVRGVKSRVVTPWGTSELEIAEAGTGNKAATVEALAKANITRP